MDGLVNVIVIVGGLVALLKGVIDIIKDYHDNPGMFSSLFSRPKSRLAVIFLCAGFILIAVFAWLSQGRTGYVLTAQIYDIDFDRKNNILDSKEIELSSGKTVPNDIIRETGEWIDAWARGKYDPSLKEIKVFINVPQDINSEGINIMTRPEADLNKYVYIIEEGSKLRIKTELSSDIIRSMNRDFVIEIGIPGYSRETVRIKWGKEEEKEIVLTPESLKIGVEDFSGDKNSVGMRLASFLSKNKRLSIKGPEALKNLAEEIRKNREFIAKNPYIQMQIRTALEVDYIISGSLDKEE